MIAEVKSRLEASGVRKFIQAVQSLGFGCKHKVNKNIQII
jgi:hypothetical protein